MIGGLTLIMATVTFAIYIVSLFLPGFSGPFSILLKIGGFTSGALFVLFCMFALGTALVRVVHAVRDEWELIRVARRK